MNGPRRQQRRAFGTQQRQTTFQHACRRRFPSGLVIAQPVGRAQQLLAALKLFGQRIVGPQLVRAAKDKQPQPLG